MSRKENNQVTFSIPDLWKAPFPLTFQQVINAANYLNTREKKILTELEEFYITKETIVRRGGKDLYHAHGVLSATTLAYTLNSWNLSEEIDYLAIIAAALLHDFGGFIDKKKNFAESINLLISAELLVLLGRPTVDEVYKLLKYASYDTGYPITWGHSLMDDHLYEVKIDENVEIEGLLLAYSDIVAQMSSPSYAERRREMLSLLGLAEDYIPPKIIALSDLLVYTLEKRTGKKVPDAIKSGFKENTKDARKEQNYKLMFESK